MAEMNDEVLRIAAKIERQAECLEGYAEKAGHEAKPVPSVFHSQAMHFRDYAAELRRAAEVRTNLPADRPHLLEELQNEADGIRDGHPCADQSLLRAAKSALEALSRKNERMVEAHEAQLAEAYKRGWSEGRASNDGGES